MEKESVKDFYDNIGWKLEGDDTRDAIINENLTKVAEEYVSKVRLRILENVGGGKYLLDIGCGPIQYPEYIEYSKNFEFRVCVDLSEEALKLARSKIGAHGRYIVGDYLALETLQEAPFDGATLINVLYHVEKESQETLVRKILGDLRPGGRLVIVYSNPRTFSAFLTAALVRMKHFMIKVTQRENGDDLQNPIYFYRHPSKFWNRFEDQSEVSIKAWRTFSPALEKLFFRKRFFGHFLLLNLFRIENWDRWYKYSEYSIIVLQKN
jgi:SAM-dependent methyltransferase